VRSDNFHPCGSAMLAYATEEILEPNINPCTAVEGVELEWQEGLSIG
jgi:hypothetical protein